MDGWYGEHSWGDKFRHSVRRYDHDSDRRWDDILHRYVFAVIRSTANPGGAERTPLLAMNMRLTRRIVRALETWQAALSSNDGRQTVSSSFLAWVYAASSLWPRNSLALATSASHFLS
jgi:hypothetical protein